MSLPQAAQMHKIILKCQQASSLSSCILVTRALKLLSGFKRMLRVKRSKEVNASHP